MVLVSNSYSFIFKTSNVGLVFILFIVNPSYFLGSICHGEGYGEPCDLNYGPIWGKQCDTQHILICRNGTCDCVYTYMVYHEVHQLCLSPVNKNCGLNHNYWILECVEHATCQDISQTAGSNSSSTTAPPVMACRCNDGFVPTTKKDCKDEHFLPNSTYDPYAPEICCPA